ncbi:high affinity cGMP-specific 3',5'-cyclic phosphodiesterase 9A-like [Aplysia californica]|uniref:High affinity cGMP-specific 3',5'-cyclic phosphodiesterase 9A-like n=1 Tax=Aplysia californica TaxID=6500 RepID=A0ABM1VSA7_APLCA|nr:high affinity cGMP-specific 3',5'-cyclic phosphodiesterase 9A-like [Aplysia californica]
MEETKSHLNHRINMLEKRIEIEGLKAVEIEKCKSEISYIRDQLWNAQKNTPISDETKISLKKDVPNYPKVRRIVTQICLVLGSCQFGLVFFYFFLVYS